MQFIVTIENDAEAVYDLMHFCQKRKLNVRPYQKREYRKIITPKQQTEMNPPSPARKAILQALKSGPLQKYTLYDKLPNFTKMSINATLWPLREAGWIHLRYKKYSITPNGKLELKRLEEKNGAL
jgi:hypothetical protein